MAKRTRKTALPTGGDAVPQGQGQPPFAVAVATPPAHDRSLPRDAYAASGEPARVTVSSEIIHAEHLVVRAMVASRPGKKSGPASELWEEIGLGKVHEAARMRLIEHMPVKAIHKALKLPQAKERALDRLLAQIYTAHTRLLMAEIDRQEQVQVLLAGAGENDVGAQVRLMTSLLIRRMTPVVARLDWDEMEATDRNNVMRLMEMLTEASKNFAEIDHKDAQTRRLLGMIQDELDAADGKGEKVLDTSRVRALLAEHMGLKPQPAPAPAPAQGDAPA